MIRTYEELIDIQSFEERFKYLQVRSEIGLESFGFDRYLNQAFYRSKEWKKVRDFVIIRDNGCDLAHDEHMIVGKIIIHHMNPVSKEQILNRDPILFDPAFLICTNLRTHNAIHYGDETQIAKGPIVRSVNDTCPWK